MIVFSANTPQSRDNRAPAPATRVDGTNFPYRMFYDNDRSIADMDSPAEALDVLLPGYLSLTQEQKRVARQQLAETVQLKARAVIGERITPTTAENLPEWAWNTLISREDPYGWGTGEGTLGEHEEDSEQVDVWPFTIPLVLLTTSYAPYTDIPRPISHEGDFEIVSNIIWIRPAEELELLDSLNRIGFINFGAPTSL